MAETQGEQTTTIEASAASEEKPSYVLARSRNDRGFNRGGFRWEKTWTAVSFEAFEAYAKDYNAKIPAGSLAKPVSAAKLIQSVLDEQALDAQLITAEEAQRYKAQRTRVIAGDVTPEALHDLIVAQAKKIEDLEATVKGLQAQLGGDRPPRNEREKQDLLAGSRGRAPASRA